MTFIPIVIGVLGTVIKGLIKGLENLEITGNNNYIIEIGQISEKSLEGSRRLAVTQSPGKDHQILQM